MGNKNSAVQIEQAAKALSMINDIDVGIESAISERIQQIADKIDTILKPKPSDEVKEPGIGNPPSVNSALITRLEETHGRIDIVINLLDNIISRIDI